MKALINQTKNQTEIIRLTFAALLVFGLLFSSFSCCKDDIPETEPEKVVIMFGVDVGEGELFAEVDGAKVSSPSEVEKGKTVVFKATHSKGWSIKYWKINGEIIRSIEPTQTFENISKHTEVRLGLQKWIATPQE